MIETRIGSLCLLALLATACSSEPPTPETAGPAQSAQRPPAAPPSRSTTAGNPPQAASSPPPAARAQAPPQVVLPPPAREVTEEELQPLRDAVTRDLDDVAAQRNLARLLWEGGQYDLALNHFERAVQIDPNDPQSLSDLGRAYEKLGRPSDAQGAYRRMATIPAVYHLALRELGNLAMNQGDLPAATGYLAQAVESQPDYMDALYDLGVVYEQGGRFREAYETYARVIQLEPPETSAAVLKYVDALYRMGKLDLKMGATDRAVEILTEVVGAYPAHPEAHYELGRALQLVGREEQAGREFAIHERLVNEGAEP